MANGNPATTKKPHTIHTITIFCKAGTPAVWDYKIVPSAANPKKARLRRGDTVQWKSRDGDWKVFFKGLTPLIDAEGIGIASLQGVSGGPAVGGTVTKAADLDDEFVYGVMMTLDSDGSLQTDDPEIIIDSDNRNKKKK